MVTFGKLQQMSQGDGYTPGCLLDYLYFKKH